MNGSSGIKEEKQSKKNTKKSQKALEKLSKKKKKRKTKDPDAPKRPLGPYFYYFKENNSRIKQEHPEFIQKEVVAKIAADWKNLTDEQKQPFVEQSKEDKLRYLREKEAYDEQKRKEEEEAGDEENKYNDNGNEFQIGRRSNSKTVDRNGHKRHRREITFDPKTEKMIRLKDIIGEDQFSCPSDSAELAEWSPPSSSKGEPRERQMETVKQDREVDPKQENDRNMEEEEKHRHEGNFLIFRSYTEIPISQGNTRLFG